MERLVRRSSTYPPKLEERRRKSEGGSDTHQLQFAKMMGFAEKLNTSYALSCGWMAGYAFGSNPPYKLISFTRFPWCHRNWEFSP
jgi:hypothetical protein